MVKQIKISGEIGVNVTLNDVILQTLDLKDGDSIVLVVDSFGGYIDEAIDIYSYIRNLSNKYKIVATNSGDVMSAATVIFLAADERYFDVSKGEFLIHLPWLNTMGNKYDLIDDLKQLVNYENKTLQIYRDRTGSDINILRALMERETYLTSEEIEKLNFAKTIKSEVANKTKNKVMANAKLKNTMSKKLEQIEKLVKALAEKFRVKNIVLTDINGNELDFGADITDEAQITLGVTATVNGVPAAGEYILEQFQGGKVLLFAQGVLTEIRDIASDSAHEQEKAASGTEELVATLNEVVNLFKESIEKIVETEKKVRNLENELNRIKTKFGVANFANLPAETNADKKIVKKFNI